jgi:hypothetical protein
MKPSLTHEARSTSDIHEGTGKSHNVDPATLGENKRVRSNLRDRYSFDDPMK